MRSGEKCQNRRPSADAAAAHVKLTHPDRLYWPDEGVTKEGLADYYTEVWRYIAPYIVGRPLALLRCPNGITGEKFFQKHAWKGLNPNIVLVKDPKDPSDEPLISINDLDGLLGLVQSAVLEIHPWGSTVSDWERPDMIVMDLDPGEGVPWQAVIDAAEETRQRLSRSGSGGLRQDLGWQGASRCGAAEAEGRLACGQGVYESDLPMRWLLTRPIILFRPSTSRSGVAKSSIDYLRNQRGATAVAAYSTRARPGAAVSMPLGWDELGPGIGPDYFTVDTMPTRLAALASDPWDGFRAAAAPLEIRPAPPQEIGISLKHIPLKSKPI